jgi:hypothetical protein
MSPREDRLHALREAVRPSELPKVGGAGPPPLCHELIGIQRAEARRRSLHHGRVDLGDLAIEHGDPTADGYFVVDRGELLLYLAEQLERRWQHGDLLALDELLLPPERVVFLTEIRERLTCPRQVVEGSMSDSPAQSVRWTDPKPTATHQGKLVEKFAAAILVAMMLAIIAIATGFLPSRAG